jgi:hypothetical protein
VIYGTCLENLIPMWGVEHWEINYTLEGGFVEIHIQRPIFVDNQKGMWKIVVLKIQLESTCFGAYFTYEFYFF